MGRLLRVRCVSTVASTSILASVSVSASVGMMPAAGVAGRTVAVEVVAAAGGQNGQRRDARQQSARRLGHEGHAHDDHRRHGDAHGPGL